MEQPSPSGSTDGGELLASPLTPGGVTPGGAPSTGPGRRKAPKVRNNLDLFSEKRISNRNIK